MHAWGAGDLRIYLAKQNHGYSVSALSYDFCPHLIQLYILDFTLSHIILNETVPLLPKRNNCLTKLYVTLLLERFSGFPGRPLILF